jgi:hypothetical protein
MINKNLSEQVVPALIHSKYFFRKRNVQGKLRSTVWAYNKAAVQQENDFSQKSSHSSIVDRKRDACWMIGYYTVQDLSSEFGTKKVPPPNLKKNNEGILLKVPCRR